MAIVLENNVSDTGTNVTQLDIGPLTVSDGNTAVIFVFGDDESVVIESVTASGTEANFTRATRISDTNFGFLEAWIGIGIKNHSGGASSFQVNFSGSVTVIGFAAEYSGVATVGCIDEKATNSGSSLSPDSGTTGTTNQGSEVFVACIANIDGEDQSSPTNSFTEQDHVNAGAGVAAFYDKIVSATDTANVSVTVGGSADWLGTILTLREKTGGEPERIQAAANSGSASSLSVNVENTVASSTLVAYVSIGDDVDFVESIATTGGSSTWNRVSRVSSGVNLSTEVWIARNVPINITSVDVTLNASDDLAIVVEEYDSKLRQIDVFTTGSGSSTSPASGTTAQTGHSEKQLYSAVVVNIDSDTTQGSSTNNFQPASESLDLGGGVNSLRSQIYQKLVTNASAQGFGVTLNNSEDWAVILVKFIVDPLEHPITRVQTATNTITSSTSLGVTLGSAPTVGNFLLAYISIEDAGISVDNISQTGTTWQKIAEAEQSGASEAKVEAWIAPNQQGTNTSITINFSGNVGTGGAIAQVFEYSGVMRSVSSISVDEFSTNSGTSASSFSIGSTGSPTVAQEIFVAAICHEDDSIVQASATNNYLEIDEQTVGSTGTDTIRTHVYERFSHIVDSSGVTVTTPDGSTTAFAGIVLKLRPYISKEENSVNSGATSALVVNFSAPTDGNFLIMQVAIKSGSVSVNNITQTGAIWTQATSAVNAGGVTTEIWYAQNISGAGTSATINLSALSDVSAIYEEYNGILASGDPVDQTGSNTGTSATPSTGTTTASTQAEELWIANIANENSHVQFDPTDDFGYIDKQLSSDIRHHAYHQYALATSADGLTTNVDASSDFAATIVKFFAAAPLILPFNRIQSACNSSDSTSALAVTLSSTPTTGNTLFALIGIDPPNQTDEVTSISQTGVTNWTRVANIGINDPLQGATVTETAKGEIWMAQNVSGSPSTTVTINLSGTAAVGACVLEYDQILAVGSPIDRVSGNAQESSATAEAGITQNVRNSQELFLGLVANVNNSVTQSNPTNGYSLVDEQTYIDTNGGRLGVYEKFKDTIDGADPSFDVSLSGAEDYVHLIATFTKATPSNGIVRRQEVRSFDGPTDVTLDLSPLDGSTLVLISYNLAGFLNRSSAIEFITQTGATWRRAGAVRQAGETSILEVWYAQNVLSAGILVDTTYTSSPVQPVVHVIEYEGLLRRGQILDIIQYDEGQSSSPDSGATGTPTFDDELYIGAIGNDTGPNRVDPSTIPSPYNYVANQESDPTTNNVRSNIYEAIVDSAVTTGISGTLAGGSEDWSAITAKFRPDSDSFANEGAIPRQIVNANGTGSGSVVINLDSAPEDHNGLILIYSDLDPNVNLTAVTQTGATWVQAFASVNPGENFTEVWYAQNVKNAVSSITLSKDDFSVADVIVIEYEGLAMLGPMLDRVATNNGVTSGGTASTGTTAVTTQASELVITAFTLDDGDNLAFDLLTDGTTNYRHIGSRSNGTAGSQSSVTVYERILTTTGVQSQTIEISDGSATDFSSGIATFFLQPLGDVPHTTDTLLKAEQEVSHTTDSLLKIVVDTSHTTDSLLKLESDTDHTTDSLLKDTVDISHTTDTLLDQESTVSHFTDTSLQGEIEVSHLTDASLGPPLRDIILTNLISVKTPEGPNVGQFEVRLLGIGGNDLSPNNFEFLQPPQEFDIASNVGLGIELFIKDPIIKKKL